MIIGSCKIKLRLFSPNSLKEKRMIIKSLTEKLKQRFNISVAEVGDNDLWQVSTIGIAVVSNNGVYANEVINKVINYIDDFNSVEIVSCEIEML